MTQLIIDGIELPESIRDTYKAWKEDLGVELIMISGRMTKEIRGKVWRVSYQHGYFDEETKNRLIAACEKGRNRPITCGFLQQDAEGGELTFREFFVTEFTRPKFAWSTAEQTGEETVRVSPIWYDFGVELREVRPGD